MRIGMLIFPDLTQLDFTGPYEVFIKLPGAKVHVIAKSLEPVAANGGLRLLPDTTYATCPQLDLVFVPGGPGVGALMEDEETLALLRRQSEAAKYVTSVCTGTLVLGAAGLLKGYKATTHWLSLDLLPIFKAVPSGDRIVKDGNRITGGGVTAGIDFALAVAAEIAGEDKAKEIQLLMEYNPAPPFDSGHPSTADAKTVEAIRKERAALQAKRTEQARRVAARYCD
jgi:cyclohexyl-isocyanide hydratase